MVSAANVTLTSTGGTHYLRAGIPEGPYYKRASVKFFECTQPTHQYIHPLIHPSIHPPVNPASQPALHLRK